VLFLSVTAIDQIMFTKLGSEVLSSFGSEPTVS